MTSLADKVSRWRALPDAVKTKLRRDAVVDDVVANMAMEGQPVSKAWEEGATMHRPPRDATVLLNDNLDWTRGKRSAHATHAALALHGIKYTHAVRVLNAKPRDIIGDHTYLREDGAPLACAEKTPGALIIKTVVRGSDSRDDTARIAAECALRFYGIEGRVTPHGVRSEQVRTLPVVIHDAGRTELAPGTLTASADWTYRVIRDHPEVLDRLAGDAPEV